MGWKRTKGEKKGKEREKRKSPESERPRINEVREKEREKQNPRVSFIGYRQLRSHAGSTKYFVQRRKEKMK